eukprot:COSAG02_NODE_45637_length_355_cov_0.910156_1_plen_20_part_01
MVTSAVTCCALTTFVLLQIV